MTDLRTAAQQALEYMKSVGGIDMYPEEWAIVERLEAALAEEALQRLTDVQQEMERNFCPRCGKRTNDIHTCTPPQAEPVQEPVAWLFTNLQSGDYDFCYQEDEHDHDREMWHKQPLYTAPPQRKPLTDEELSKIIDTQIGFNSCVGWEEDFARAVERAHGIGV